MDNLSDTITYRYDLCSSRSILLQFPAEYFPHRQFIPPLFKPEVVLPNIEPSHRIWSIHLLFNGEPPPGTLPLYRFRNDILIDALNKDRFIRIRENRFELKQHYLEIAIGISVSSILVNEGFLTLHSASISQNHRGFLFIGESGAGKTTLAEIARKAGIPVINDELSMLRSEEPESVRLYPPPFWGPSFFSPKMYQAPSEWIAGIPLHTVFSLERSSEPGTRVTPIPVVDSAVRLIRSFFSSRFVHQLPASIKGKAFFGLTRLARSVPLYRLSIDLRSFDLLEILSANQNQTLTQSEVYRELAGNEHLAAVFGLKTLLFRLRDFTLFQISGSTPYDLNDALKRVGNDCFSG